MIQPKIKYRVRCSDREVGEISRIIADPIAKSISHIVVKADGQEYVVPHEKASIEGETLALGFPASQLSGFPKLRREDFVELKEVEIAGLERRLEEVSAGETLVPIPQLEKDPTRRSFFIKMTNAIGLVLALPLVYPIVRYLSQPLYQPFDNTWFKIGRAEQFADFDVPQLVKFRREIKEGYLTREFNKSHWAVRASEALREQIQALQEKLYGDHAFKYKDHQGKVVWENDPNAEIVVFSGKCPHLGCAYKWKENHKTFGKVFWCPCHLSIYAPSGEVLDGPAPRPLDVMPARVGSGGTIEVIDAEFKSGKSHIVRVL